MLNYQLYTWKSRRRLHRRENFSAETRTRGGACLTAKEVTYHSEQREGRVSKEAGGGPVSLASWVLKGLGATG